MGKFWSLLFGATMLGCLGLFLVAPFIDGWWLQEGVSSHYWAIDELFYVILFITGFFFILTEAIMVCFMFRYASQADGKPPTLAPSVVANLLKPLTNVLNEPHKIELAWTIIPAGILLYIAFAQIGTWMKVKYQSQFPAFVKESGKKVVVTEISSRQWEWRVRYPGVKRMKEFLANKDEKGLTNFGKQAHFDDIKGIPNELHTIKGHPTLVHLSTRDVIHSFNMPHLRIKQDALPGKVIPVWFIAVKSNTVFNPVTQKWEDGFEESAILPLQKKLVGLSEKFAKATDPKEKDAIRKEIEGSMQPRDHIWDIACAELCGWGHYRMVGRLFVHDTEADFLEWLKHVEDAQNARK